MRFPLLKPAGEAKFLGGGGEVAHPDGVLSGGRGEWGGSPWSGWRARDTLDRDREGRQRR